MSGERFAIPRLGRAFQVSVGVRPLDLADWLQAEGPDVDEQLGLRRDLLDHHREQVLGVTPGGAEGARELAGLVSDWMGEPRPAPSVGAEEFLAAAGRCVPEDLCVLSRGRSGTWRLEAAVVCFPSRWRLSEALGRTMAEIHAPVAGYERIGSAVDAVLDRLDPDRPLARTNWTILSDPALFQPLPTAVVQPHPSRLTLRLERQTLRGLPATGDIAFTIRTRTAPLGEVIGEPAVAQGLLDTLRSVPPASVAYKGWSELLPALLDWLGAAAAESTGPPGTLPMWQ